MVRARLEGINTVRKRLSSGAIATYYYHRATGTRLLGDPGSATFLTDYAVAEKSLSNRHGGTFNGLVRDYTQSPEFAKRADSTKKEYRRMLTKAEGRFGDMPLAVLEDPRVRLDFMKWRAEVARTSGDREADNRLSVISAMLTWAIGNGIIFSNHVSGFTRLHSVDRARLTCPVVRRSKVRICCHAGVSPAARITRGAPEWPAVLRLTHRADCRSCCCHGNR